jgi:hypothetical protein
VRRFTRKALGFALATAYFPWVVRRAAVAGQNHCRCFADYRRFDYRCNLGRFGLGNFASLGRHWCRFGFGDRRFDRGGRSFDHLRRGFDRRNHFGDFNLRLRC